MPGEQALDVDRKIPGQELLCRHVDGHARIGPAFAPPAAHGFGRRFQDPVVQVEHQAGLFGNFDELAGRDDLVVAAFPAQQRLDGDGAPPAQAHLGLVVEHQFPALDGLAQRLLDAEAVRRLHEHRRVVDAQAVAAQFLGAEQRDIRRTQQRRRIATMLGEHGDAAAHADAHLAPVDEQRPLEACDQVLGVPFDLGGVARVGEHQRELVAAQSRDEAGFAGDIAQALPDLGRARGRRIRGRACR